CRILPFDLGTTTLGAVKVRDLSGGHVEALVTGLRRDHFAPDTVRVAYRIVSTLLNRAVTRGLLPSNPVSSELRQELQAYVEPKKDTIKAFTKAEAQQFLAVSAKHSRLHHLYVTGLLTGMRVGELTGLRLDDDQRNEVNGRPVRQLRVARSLD